MFHGRPIYGYPKVDYGLRFVEGYKGTACGIQRKEPIGEPKREEGGENWECDRNSLCFRLLPDLLFPFNSVLRKYSNPRLDPGNESDFR